MCDYDGTVISGCHSKKDVHLLLLGAEDYSRRLETKSTQNFVHHLAVDRMRSMGPFPFSADAIYPLSLSDTPQRVHNSDQHICMIRLARLGDTWGVTERGHVMLPFNATGSSNPRYIERTREETLFAKGWVL